ncbi:hypothetical protein [Catellatospora tritici]|uniref:hypothetical protein n=1 Tax=Catellatospora tritici TaxID=2851566 RepID=UPI0020C50FC7|nr:hypothetical protein [Catellatospora tritici]
MIVDLQFDELRQRLAERRITLQVSARKVIAEQGYDPVYGARPLRRYIAREVETRIARAIIAGDLGEEAVIGVDAQNGELMVTFQRTPAREMAHSGAGPEA